MAHSKAGKAHKKVGGGVGKLGTPVHKVKTNHHVKHHSTIKVPVSGHKFHGKKTSLHK